MKNLLFLICTVLFGCQTELDLNTQYVQVSLSYDRFVTGVSSSSMGRKSYTDWKGHVLSSTSKVDIEFIGDGGEYELIETVQTNLSNIIVSLKIGTTYDILLWGEEAALQQGYITFDGEAIGVKITEGMSNIMIKCESEQSLILVDNEGLLPTGSVCWYVPKLDFTLPAGSYTGRCATDAGALKDGFYYSYVLTQEIAGNDLSWIDYEVKFRLLDGTLKSVFIVDPQKDTVYLVWAEESKLTGTVISNDYADLLGNVIEIGVK